MDVLMPSLALREDCPDLKDSRVLDIVGVSRVFSVATDIFGRRVDAANAGTNIDWI
ncbi:MAG: hypothetical protein ABI129_11340 [Rhodanobacter sp.]